MRTRALHPDKVKAAHKEGIIAAASAARSIEMDRSWIIDGQVHAFVELPRTTRICQNAGDCSG